MHFFEWTFFIIMLIESRSIVEFVDQARVRIPAKEEKIYVMIMAEATETMICSL